MAANAPTFAIPTKNALIPPEGPKCVPVNLDFTTNPSYEVDLSGLMGLGLTAISLIQGVFIDNSLGAAPVALTPAFSAQTIFCPPGYQGYFPVLAPQQQAKFEVVSSGNGSEVNLFFYNMPLPASVWPAIAGNVFNLNPSGYVKVTDVAFDALIANGFVPTQPYELGDGDVIKPKRGQAMRFSVVQLLFGTSVSTVIATGNPYYFIKGLRIGIYGGSFLAAAGAFNIQLADSSAGVIWKQRLYLPNAAPAPGQFWQPLLSTDDFDWTSHVNASTLTLSCDNVDFHGTVDCALSYGLTSVNA